MIRAMIVVDAQKDFCEGGALPVDGGSRVCYRIADAINNLSDRALRYQFIVGTKDWHIPADSNGGHISRKPDYVSTWPEHCIQGSEGAQFHPAIADVAWGGFDAVFYKGQGRPDYSGFQGVAPALYGDEVYLHEWLSVRKVTHLDIVGLATEYCVRETAMDAVQFGFNVRIPLSLTEAVGGEDAKLNAIRQVMAAQGMPDSLIN